MIWSKIGTVVFDPVACFLLAVAAVGILRALGLHRTAASVPILAVGGLVLTSIPVLSHLLLWQLERQFLPVSMADSPVADAAIVLGGAIAPPIPPRLETEFTESSDRAMHAADLFLAGKVKAIIVSGGNLPWAPDGPSEAELIGALLQKWGVPASAIILESSSRNTGENAARTSEIWLSRGFRSALLVTSAFHMPRALASFEAAGVPVLPASTDIRVTWPLAASVLDFLPRSDALQISALAIKEIVGLAVYRWRGWLDPPVPEKDA